MDKDKDQLLTPCWTILSYFLEDESVIQIVNFMLK